MIGAGCKKELLVLGDFKERGLRVQSVTEDGSFAARVGHRPVERGVGQRTRSSSDLHLRPQGMLRAVASWAAARNVSCQVSLEAWMACGLGACLGCAVARPTAGGLSYAKVCQDGPVFEAQEVAWDA